MSDKMDMRISGSSTMPGGDYGAVSISGSGKINGNVRADSIRCSGSAKVLGNVITDDFSCSGSCSLKGDAQARKVHTSGAIKVEGTLTGDEIRVSGALKVKRSIRGSLLKVSGGLSVAEDVEGEEFYLSGTAKIEGLLNAEKIEISTSTPTSKIKDIGCSSLKVRKANGGFLKKIFGTDYALEAGSIEADLADLEYTRADVIRGRELHIGDGCRIRRVEYSGTCEAADGTVEELVKV